MKHLFLSFAFLFIAGWAHANHSTKSGMDVFCAAENDTLMSTLVEEKPRFQGGDEKQFSNWFFSVFEFPEAAYKEGIDGRLVLQFVVNTEGKVTDVSVRRSLGGAIDSEALRVMALAPDWAPGTQSGQLVNVKYIMPFNFKISPVAQIDTKEPIYTAQQIDVQPRFITNQNDLNTDDALAFVEWFASTFTRPNELKREGLNGQCYVQYVVSKSGKVINVEVVNSLDSSIDEEVVRVMSEAPQWIPGKKNKEAVNVGYTIPMTFMMTKKDTSVALKKKEPEAAKNTNNKGGINKKPSFKGKDINAFFTWFNSRIKYPEDLRQRGIGLKAIMSFIVDTEGDIVDVVLYNSVDLSVELEVFRLLSKAPKWTPGIKNGTPVNVRFAVPLVFRLK